MSNENIDLEQLAPWQRELIDRIVAMGPDERMVILMPREAGHVRFEPYRTKDEHPAEPMQSVTVDVDELDSPSPAIGKGDTVYIDDEPHLVLAGTYPDGTLEVVKL